VEKKERRRGASGITPLSYPTSANKKVQQVSGGSSSSSSSRTGRAKRVHRNRMSIIASMLKVAAKGARKTHIMYRAGLSYDQLQDYLAFLKQAGLVEETADQEEDLAIVYRTTPKGLKFVEKFSSLRELVGMTEENEDE
jgi:predicted transcriptional regulator